MPHLTKANGPLSQWGREEPAFSQAFRSQDDGWLAGISCGSSAILWLSGFVTRNNSENLPVLTSGSSSKNIGGKVFQFAVSKTGNESRKTLTMLGRGTGEFVINPALEAPHCPDCSELAPTRNFYQHPCLDLHLAHDDTWDQTDAIFSWRWIWEMTIHPIPFSTKVCGSLKKGIRNTNKLLLNVFWTCRYLGSQIKSWSYIQNYCLDPRCSAWASITKRFTEFGSSFREIPSFFQTTLCWTYCVTSYLEMAKLHSEDTDTHTPFIFVPGAWISVPCIYVL